MHVFKLAARMLRDERVIDLNQKRFSFYFILIFVWCTAESYIQNHLVNWRFKPVS